MIESQHLTDKKYSFTIALETVSDKDWFWTPEELERFDVLWNDDVPIERMAVVLKRSEIAILLNAIDRLVNGFIEPREGWKIW